MSQHLSEVNLPCEVSSLGKVLEIVGYFHIILIILVEGADLWLLSRKVDI